MQIWTYARRSAVLAAVLTIAVMVFYIWAALVVPYESLGFASQLAIDVLIAPVYGLQRVAYYWKFHPLVLFGTMVLVEFVYFLIIVVVVRACIDALRSRQSASAL